MSTGKIFAAARADMAKFVTTGGFNVDITLSNTDKSKTVDVTGLASGIWINYDNDGNSVNTAKNHVSIPESVLNTLEYPVRNANGKVAMTKHFVSHTDVNGTLRNYIVDQCYPNETLGLIVLILGYYSS